MYGLQTEGRTTLTFAIRRKLAITLFVTFFLDYSTKFLALKYLGPNPRKIFGSILQFNLSINYGAAFGLGEQSGKFFAIFAITFLAVVFYIGRRLDSIKWAISLGILAGGITGNLTDRIFRAPGKLNGGVVDWIQIPHWPIFNLADISINISVLLILILLIKNVPLNSQRLKNG